VLLVTLLAALSLTSCRGEGADAERTAAEARACASLRERVTGRALDDAGPLSALGLPDRRDPKRDPLGPAAFADDPEAWYAALEQALAAADLGPSDAPASVSPASRLVRTCQELGR
jgi:hypothetical protein